MDWASFGVVLTELKIEEDIRNLFKREIDSISDMFDQIDLPFNSDFENSIKVKTA